MQIDIPSIEDIINSLEKDCPCYWQHKRDESCKECKDTNRVLSYEGKLLLEFLQRHTNIVLKEE